ncbi:MAG: sugar transferase [Verrucomicrobia bacterium]|nr:sugar transferase [Verrucomicrobiota bacterium]
MLSFIKSYPPYKWLLAFADLVILNLSFAIALRLRFMPDIDIINFSKGRVASEVFIFAAYSLLWILVFQWLDLYKRQYIFSKARQAVAILRGEIYGLIGIVLIQFFLKPFDLSLESRLMFLYFMVISFVLLLSYRLGVVRSIFRSELIRTIIEERALIVGSGPEGRLLAAQLLEDGGLDVKLAGFISEDEPVGETVFGGYAVLGDYRDFERVIAEQKVNSVYIAERIPVQELLRLAEEINRHAVQVHASIKDLSILTQKVSMDFIGSEPMIRMGSGHRMVLFRVIKRITDIIGALIGVLLLSPVMVYIGWRVKRSSPGPVIFSQTRIGKRGKPFKFYKFRSMTIGSDQDPAREQEMARHIASAKPAEAPPLSKVVNESRLTDLGRIIRRYSLDELPQLFNVLKGDMSLVGPRPCLPYEWEAYHDWHRKRLDATPGCTGLWQVSGRSETSFDNMVILDLYYIENMSPWLDLQILLKTIPVILTGKGGG